MNKPTVSTISWSEQTGNKFNKSIDSAMLSDEGYAISKRIRVVGDTVPKMFNVVYDRDFVIEYLRLKLIKPLAALGKETIFDLIT